MAERFGTRGTRILFRVGWWAIVVLTGLFTLNHLVGAVAFASSDDERMMFLVFAGMQALSLVVLFVPYRRAEWWAWWASGGRLSVRRTTTDAPWCARLNDISLYIAEPME